MHACTHMYKDIYYGLETWKSVSVSTNKFGKTRNNTLYILNFYTSDICYKVSNTALVADQTRDSFKIFL